LAATDPRPRLLRLFQEAAKFVIEDPTDMPRSLSYLLKFAASL
jgi:hypothetical protein